jgi:uncharacterized repeat protein (TIGR01451 family)
MQKRFSSIIIMFTVLCVIGSPAWAVGKSSIELTSVAELEKEAFNEEGMKVLKRVPAAKVIPGDEVIYTISYSNQGKEKADNVLITNPIPEHMLYQNGSASGTGSSITFSVDGGKTYDLPEKLTIVNSNGKKVPAKSSDFTHIRWTLNQSVKPGEKGQVVYRALLE